MMDSLHSGDILARLRRAYGISQADLAKDLGVSRPYLSEVENGREPGMEMLKAAAKCFDVPVAIFMMGDDAGDDNITKSFRRILDAVLTAAEKKASA